MVKGRASGNAKASAILLDVKKTERRIFTLGDETPFIIHQHPASIVGQSSIRQCCPIKCNALQRFDGIDEYAADGWRHKNVKYAGEITEQTSTPKFAPA